MSVINKMLQDLETRESQAEVVNADYQPPEKNKSNIRVIVLLMIAVIAIAYGLVTHPTDETGQVSEPVTSSPERVKSINQSMQIVEPEEMTVAATVEPVLVGESGFIQQPVEQVEQLVPENSAPADETQLVNQMSENLAPLVPEVEQAAEQITAAEKSAKFTMSGSGADKQLLELKQNISENLAAGNLAQASILLSQLLKSEAGNVNARKKLASLKFSQGNYVQAKLLLTTGVELFPDRADFRLMLARVCMAQNQATQAMSYLSEFQPRTDAEEFYAYRAGLARQLKQLELAQSDYLHLTTIAPLNGKWWLGLAIIEEQLGNGVAALPAYQKAKQSNQLENVVNEFVEQRIQILLGAE